MLLLHFSNIRIFGTWLAHLFDHVAQQLSIYILSYPNKSFNSKKKFGFTAALEKTFFNYLQTKELTEKINQLINQ